MKVLILRYSSIGDIILTTPVIRALKNQLGAEILYLTKAKFSDILENNPNVDKVYSMKSHNKEVIPLLKKEKYDFIIDLHKNLRSLQIKKALRIRSKSFNKLNIEKWLIVNLKINRLPSIHIVDRYMETVSYLGVKNDGMGLDYFIAKKDKIAMNRHIQGDFISFAIGGQHATKRLPKNKILEICNKSPLPIVLLGGPNDKSVGKFIEKESSNKVINFCGKLNLNQSASVVKQSVKLFTHDTGMMHIGAALNKEVISFWGNTVPEFGMAPYYPKGQEKGKILEVKNLYCRPCSKIGYSKCPKKHFKCMNDIETTKQSIFL